MKEEIKARLLKMSNASEVWKVEKIQTLWGGYGELLKVHLKDGDLGSLIVKSIELPKPEKHPRGWNTNRSHQRKLKSYQVETHWYQSFNQKCGGACRTPKCLHVEEFDNEIFIVLEDLDAAGYPLRHGSVGEKELDAVLAWLANFHATFMMVDPQGLWDVGTYWHLATRPDELGVLDDRALKGAAQKIDEVLSASPYRSFVHGDAKIANFCFAEEGSVAAVDFQYVGGGCGMKDLAYFVGSCFYEEECEAREKEILDRYFSHLKKALIGKPLEKEYDLIEENWRKLYPYAWADFHRFLKGWSPGHWKINSYSEKVCRQVIEEVNS